MTTLLLTHPACLDHDNSDGHPESPERLRAILAELKNPDYAGLEWQDAPLATLDQIARVHDRTYIDHILALVPTEGRAELDHETSLTPQSGEAALRAVGAVIVAVDAVCSGAVAVAPLGAEQSRQIKNAFCAVRPPGHHAAVPPASGFCLFNSIAVGAAHALATDKAKRIAIVDFDVHHGNGTQAWAETEGRVLFLSSHQFPLWPGSGAPDERGPKRNIVNLPLPPHTDGTIFRAVWENGLQAIDKFKPDLIMISAGFDAHKDDPLASIDLTENDFVWITQALMRLAAQHAQGRIVSTLEGGYNVAALASSAGAHVKALMSAG